MRDLTLCRTADLDDIFYATKESQGYKNAILAIKYVLFDDASVFEDGEPEGNKYAYISNLRNARKKAMILQKDDLAHILVKYCMASFGLRNRDFTINDDEFLINQKRVDRLELSAYEMIEQVAYAAMKEVYIAYDFLFANYKLLMEVVEYMLQERYTTGIKESIDNFNGIIDNKDVAEDIRYAFYDAYNNLDDNFAEIKRNNPDYIK